MTEHITLKILNSSLLQTFGDINNTAIELNKTVRYLSVNGSDYTCGTLTVTGLGLLPINIDVVKDETVPIGFVKVIFN